MASYIIRLDDACPQMNIEKWERIERLLNKYNVEPIVGIIPDNHDPEFVYGNDNEFWERCLKWQENNWVIAIHGLHHSLKKHEAKGYYQKSHSLKTEWAGLSTEKQLEMLERGFQILCSHGLTASCFFAPCHTYDSGTVKAIARFNMNHDALYLSDGYALRPFKKDGVWFLPSIFDTPHSYKGTGVLTFVFHPNNMSDESYVALESFLIENKGSFVNADALMKSSMSGNPLGQGLVGMILENGIYLVRAIRRLLH